MINQCSTPIDNTPLSEYLRYDFSNTIERLFAIETKLLLSDMPDSDLLDDALRTVRTSRQDLVEEYKNLMKILRDKNE